MLRFELLDLVLGLAVLFGIYFSSKLCFNSFLAVKRYDLEAYQKRSIAMDLVKACFIVY